MSKGAALDRSIRPNCRSAGTTTEMAYYEWKVKSFAGGRNIQSGTWRNTRSCPYERFDCRVFLILVSTDYDVYPCICYSQKLCVVDGPGHRRCQPLAGAPLVRGVHGHSGGQHGATDCGKLQGRPAPKYNLHIYVLLIKSIAGGRIIHTGTWRNAMTFPTTDLISHSPCVTCNYSVMRMFTSPVPCKLYLVAGHASEPRQSLAVTPPIWLGLPAVQLLLAPPENTFGSGRHQQRPWHWISLWPMYYSRGCDSLHTSYIGSPHQEPFHRPPLPVDPPGPDDPPCAGRELMA